MDAGVNDEPRRAPHLVGLAAEFIVRSLVNPHADAEPLTVQSPTFAVAREIGVLSKVRAVRPFEGERRLQAVAGTALVQHQRGQRVEGPCRQVIGVHYTTLEAAIAAGAERRHRSRGRQDGEAIAGQQPQGVFELAVDLVGDVGGARDQLVRGLGVELRVILQKVQKRREVTLPSGLLHGLVHVDVDSRHLGHANRVNLFWREIECREFADLGLVIGAPVGEVVGRQRGARMGNIFVAHERQQLCIGRRHRLGNDDPRLGAQRSAVLVGNPRWHLAQGNEEWIFFRIRDGEGRNGALASRDGHARRCEAALEPGAHIRNLLIEIAWNVAHTADVGTVFRHAIQTTARSKRCPERTAAGKGRFIIAKFLLGDECLEHGSQNRGVNLLRRDLVLGNGIQCGEHVAPILGPPALAPRVDMRKIAGACRHVVVRIGELLHPPGPFGLVQSLHLQISRRGARCRRRAGRRRVGRRRGRWSGDDAGKLQAQHCKRHETR